MFTKEKMTLRRWYGGSLYIPRYEDKWFPEFVASSVGIVKSVLHKHIGVDVSVLFRKVNTAYADPDKGQIVINQNFLKGELPEPLPTIGSDEALSLILGIIVHEAAHFAYSPSTLKPWAIYIKERTKVPFIKEIATTLGNVIEDIYIEAEVDRKTPTLSWLLDCVNQAFFSDSDFQNALESCTGIEDAPESGQGIFSVLNLLIYAKTRESLSSTMWVEKLFYTVLKARELSDLEDRFALALEVYNRLMERAELKSDGEFDSEETESEEGSEEEGESVYKSTSEERSGKEGKGKAGKKLLEELEKKSRGLTAIQDVFPEVLPNENIAVEIEQHLENSGDREVTLDTNGFIYIERTIPSDSTHLEADSRYERLSEIARQTATVNRPYGLDKTRGTTIRKLHRIATDQKIFAETVPMSGYKPMQVLILIDCSGSMYNPVKGELSMSIRDTRIYQASQAALGAARGLCDARCEVAVYGHSAQVEMGNDISIYRLKEFNEPITVLASRLHTLANNHHLLVENRDGNALAYVAKKLTNTQRRRFMFVISDGAPLASDYYAPFSIAHTREEVNKIRDSGISILSISITEEARTANDTIYGRKFNVSNTDVNVLDDVVRKVVLHSAN